MPPPPSPITTHISTAAGPETGFLPLDLPTTRNETKRNETKRYIAHGQPSRGEIEARISSPRSHLSRWEACPGDVIDRLPASRSSPRQSTGLVATARPSIGTHRAPPLPIGQVQRLVVSPARGILNLVGQSQQYNRSSRLIALARIATISRAVKRDRQASQRQDELLLRARAPAGVLLVRHS